MLRIINEENVIDALDHIMEFQLGDLKKASIVAKTNFLCAVGCMNTIEFLGGVKNNRLGDNKSGAVKSRFQEGVKLLPSDEYKNTIMYELRNALTHQYLAKIKGIQELTIANDWNTNKAIVIPEKGKLIFNVAKLIFDLGIAYGQLRVEIENNRTERERVAELLNKLPILL